jgi:hypothetical protein
VGIEQSVACREGERRIETWMKSETGGETLRRRNKRRTRMCKRLKRSQTATRQNS